MSEEEQRTIERRKQSSREAGRRCDAKRGAKPEFREKNRQRRIAKRASTVKESKKPRDMSEQAVRRRERAQRAMSNELRGIRMFADCDNVSKHFSLHVSSDAILRMCCTWECSVFVDPTATSARLKEPSFSLHHDAHEQAHTARRMAHSSPS